MTRLRYALTAAGIAGLVMGPLSLGSSAATLDQSNLPNAMHAEVENKAVILGTGAQSLYVDPGPAYSLANIDYTRYSDDEPGDVAMKARGAVLDPGTIAAAVLWAAPAGEFGASNCNNQCYETPTGLHEASGFPGYAEAFYPDANGLDRQHTAKCLWNKDASFANPTGGALQDACRSGDAEADPAYAAADTWADRLESRGFTRAEGATGSTLLSVGSSEAMSNVKPTADGKLVARGYASAKNILLANGVVQISGVKAAAEIQTKAGTGDADVAKASCNVTGLQVAGVDLPVDAGKQINQSQFKPLHDAALAQGFDVTIIPPAKPTITTDAVGKHTAGCTGLQVIIDDLRNGTVACSPAAPPPGTVPGCIPKGVGSRHEWTFGAIRITASANTFETFSSAEESATSGAPVTEASVGGGLGSDDGGLSASLGGSSVPSVLGSSVGASGGDAASSGSASGRSSGTRGSSGTLRTTSLGGPKPISRTTIAALTTATAAAIGGGIWLLIGVVMALATGSRLRLPGTRLR
jgi:hypothetical protein